MSLYLFSFAEWGKALFYGFLEGITEWLPISSTGHLILLEQILPLKASPAYISLFRIVIQLGAIAAVLCLYFAQLWPLSLKPQARGLRRLGLKPSIVRLWGLIIVACLPAAVVGLAWAEQIEALFYKPLLVGAMLILVGLAFLLIEKYQAQRQPRYQLCAELNWRLALIIGCWQLLAAVFPGVSRSGATIMGALLLGLARPLAAEFSFYLAIPTMAGASLLKLLRLQALPSSSECLYLLSASLLAFFTSLVVLRLFLNYIRRHSFKPFAYYRLCLGLLVLGLEIFV